MVERGHRRRTERRAPRSTPAAPRTPRGGARTPDGLKLGTHPHDAFTTIGKFKDPEVQHRTERAFDALGKLHKHPIPQHKIPVEGGAGRRQGATHHHASFHHSGGLGLRIQINEHGHGNEAVSAVHEYGHHLDLLLGSPRHSRFEKESWSCTANHDLMHAFNSSTAMSRWNAAWRFSDDPDPRRRKKHAAFHKYITSPHEMFARAYTQWAAMHGGDRRLRDEFVRRREMETQSTRKQTWHWTDKEFAPIAKAMEAHLRRHGLLR